MTFAAAEVAALANEPDSPFEIVCDSSDRERWLAERTKSIGASEVAMVLGMSPWGGPLALYAQKTGQMAPPNLDDNEAVFWGNKLEAAIINGYAARTGRLVKPFGIMLRSRRFPWLTATPDALTSDDGGATWWPLQVKNVGFNSAEHWQDGPPGYYRVQVIQEALVYGSTKTTAAALVAGQKLIWDDVEADDFTVRQIVNLSRTFWEDQVQKRVPPAADASPSALAALHALYPREDPEKFRVLPASLLEVDSALQDAKERRRAADAEIEALEIRIKEAIADAAHAVLPDGTRYSYTTVECKEQIRKAYSFRKLNRRAPKEKTK